MPAHAAPHPDSSRDGAAADGLAALAKQRATGTDPAHGGEAGRKRGKRNAEHVAAIERWEQQRGAADTAHPVDFARGILPRLRSVPLSVMAEATGLSLGYCSFVRRGQKVPHRRHWGSLARLGDGTKAASEERNARNRAAGRMASQRDSPPMRLQAFRL